MNKVELSQKQIQELFDFTDRLNLTYKDVKCEIVDHLASGVEDYMQEHPKTTFSLALYRYVETLPFSFFSDLIIEKTKILQKYWTKKFFSYVLTFLTIPKVIIFISLIIFHFLAFLAFGKIVMTASFFISSIFFLAAGIAFRDDIFENNELEEYLILETYSNAIGNFLGVMYFIPFLIPDAVFVKNFADQTIAFTYCFWISLFYISVYAAWFVFPKYFKKEIAEKYYHLRLNFA